MTSEHLDPTRTPSRRWLLRAAGLLAAAGVGTTALGTGGAEAATDVDGDDLVLGAVNQASSRTSLVADPEVRDEAVLLVNNGSDIAVDGLSAGLASVTRGGVAVAAFTEDAGGTAVVASNVAGGLSLYAFGANGGRIQAFLGGTTGAPSFTDAVPGEQYRDAEGAMFLCVPTLTADGAPATAWVRVAAVQPAYAGGACNLLSTPIRVLDTRPGRAAYTAPGHPLSIAGGTITAPVGGFTYDGVTVPEAISGIIVNVTAVGGTAAGYLTVYPGGGTKPGTSTVNFTAGQTVPNGATIATGVVDGDPSITIAAGGAGGTVDVLVDATGFIA